MRLVYAALCIASLAALAAARLLPMDADPGVRCVSVALFELPCPFCGTSRAFLAAGHGAWKTAVQTSPVGALVYAGVWGVALWSGTRTCRRGR
ncbi:MAG TPA: DUF2752 domain-containing protein [Kiritimatiellia bacterium]|nr:DUF2752 domain-containing protein [Kiritimatiellia bacterium]